VNCITRERITAGHGGHHGDHDIAPADASLEPQPPVNGHEQAAFEELGRGDVGHDLVEKHAAAGWMVDPEGQQVIPLLEARHPTVPFL
jgi:hypothetical protein